MGLKRIAIDEELHRKVKVAASAIGISMKDWTEQALQRSLSDMQGASSQTERQDATA